MTNLNEHYFQLLGLDDDWQVDCVDLAMMDKTVTIRLSFCGDRPTCPECDGSCNLKDHAPERTWRHLDTMQFETRIVARTPRVKCESCGVKTCAVPWAAKSSRFTLMFEAFAIEVINAAANVKAAAEVLRLSWNSIHLIMRRAVERGLARREDEPMESVGIDEKSFGSGQDYVSVMVDNNQSRVIEVVEGRTLDSAAKLWNSLDDCQRLGVQSVSMDMWAAFITATTHDAPQAQIVHDRFHISKYLGEALDKVRRRESKELARSDADNPLIGTRQMWLYNEDNLSEEQAARIEELKNCDLRTAEAWAMKENFRHFWELDRRVTATSFFNQWHRWVMKSALKPMMKVAEMIKRHLPNVLNYFDHRVSNARSEGFNSRIQSIKSAARGFRSFENYRTRILFYCGKLDLMPSH